MTDHPATITLPLEDAQALFRAATRDEFFEHEYLEIDQVHALRRLAVAIGVDPVRGTPQVHAGKFPHDPARYGPDGARCRRCERATTDPIHVAEETPDV